MKLWIGHYYGLPDEWFVAWGRTKEDAAMMVDCEIAEPDLRSMRELRKPGFIDLKVAKEEDETVLFYLAQIGSDEVDPEHQDEGKHYDNAVYIEDDVSDWIKKCIEKPFGVANESQDAVGQQLGVRQQDLLDLYKKGA